MNGLKNQFKNIFIEVGCGVGYHPIYWAKKHPQDLLVAFERTKDKFAKFQGRLKNHPDIKNIAAVHGDAQFFIPKIFENSTVSGFYFLYPNPTPKGSQKNLRLSNSPFLKVVEEKLKTNGFLSLCTNVREYANEAQEVLPRNSKLKIESVKPVTRIPQEALSHFEKKYLERKETCYELLFLKPT